LTDGSGPLRVLVVNAGSSSLKLRLVGPRDELLASADPPPVGGDAAQLTRIVAELGAIDAVGHRIVHGGVDFVGPVRIDASVVDRLQALTDLAPLHQPAALAALKAVSAALPSTPAVACFDTAFHATIPPGAATYALPAEWRDRWPIRRFGFHGLSHAYAARRAARLLGRSLEEVRLVTCHLGAGASLAAVSGGLSVDTTMGFTPLDGLMMATRSGSVDPGLVLWLLERSHLSPSQLGEALERKSGLLGLAGTSDMREVLAAEEREARDPDRKNQSGAASLAVAVYLHRLGAGIASMAAAMGGLDGLVFTGGVGENAPSIRARAAEGLTFLGIRLDPEANLGGGDRLIGAADAPVPALVIEAREDLEIAHQVRQLLERERD